MIKKVIPWVVFTLLFSSIILGFAFKDKMNGYMSEQMKNSISANLKKSGNSYIDSAFNYNKNGLLFEITFIEIGSKGCSACKRMEAVINDIRKQYPDKVNVVFFNILKSESQQLMKYYGVVAIPTQIFLDRNGNEIFRHTGFISTEEIKAKLLELGVKPNNKII
jgi:thioredoxin 1